MTLAKLNKYLPYFLWASIGSAVAAAILEIAAGNNPFWPLFAAVSVWLLLYLTKTS